MTDHLGGDTESSAPPTMPCLHNDPLHYNRDLLATRMLLEAIFSLNLRFWHLAVFMCVRIMCFTAQAGSITRADVADFMLGAVMDGDFPYLKQAPCISSLGGTSWVKDRSKAARGEA